MYVQVSRALLQYSARSVFAMTRCIACNIGIDDAVPRTQPILNSLQFQHYEVQFVA